MSVIAQVQAEGTLILLHDCRRGTIAGQACVNLGQLPGQLLVDPTNMHKAMPLQGSLLDY